MKKFFINFFSVVIMLLAVYGTVQFFDTTNTALIRAICCVGVMIVVYPTTEFIRGMLESFFTKKLKTDIVDDLEKLLPEHYRID